MPIRALRRWFQSLARRWFPKQYVTFMLTRAEQRARDELKAAKGLSALERNNLRGKLERDIWEWQEWLCEIEDKELVARALKMDIYLDEIPIPSPIDGMNQSHYTVGTFGNKLLHDETRQTLVKKVREKFPIYRKERREILDTRVKVATAIGSIIIGVVGSFIALIAMLKK